MPRRRLRKIAGAVRRIYHKSLIEKAANNPIVVGAVAGMIDNVAKGQPIINLNEIVKKCSNLDAKNPLIFLGAGILLKNKPLQAIGTYKLVDPNPEPEVSLPPSTVVYIEEKNTSTVEVPTVIEAPTSENMEIIEVPQTSSKSKNKYAGVLGLE